MHGGEEIIIKILLVPHDAGNVSPLMARRFREMGHDARTIIFAQSYLGYKVEPPDKVIGGRGVKALLLLEIKRWWVLYHALKYDVVIFTYGSTILPSPIFIGYGPSSRFGPKLRFIYTKLTYIFSYFMWDVRLLHFLGKKLVVLFQGGDARQGRILRKLNYPDVTEEPPNYYSDYTDRIKTRRAKLWNRYASVIYYHNPDLWHGLPERSKFLGYPLEVKNAKVD